MQAVTRTTRISIRYLSSRDTTPRNMSDMSTFDQLVVELTRDAQRVQPKDALQFCAKWFQSRLEEQRTRTRDALSRHPSLSSSLPQDHYMDTPLSPTAGAPGGPTSISPFSQTFPQRSSLQHSMSNTSPFGTLNVPGNALLDNSPRTLTPVSPPSFQLEGEDIAPTTPISNPNPFASFANGSISPGQNDFLHAPTGIFARRTSVSAESIPVDSETEEPLPVFPKTDDQVRRIRASIANNFIFRDLDEEQETGVLNAMQECKVVNDDVVIRQGDVGDYFYVVESGLLHCYIRPEPLPSNWFSGNVPTNELFTQPGYHPIYGRKVAECREGSSFGELALMYGHPRAATVLAIEPCTLWSLDRITFRTIILKAAHRRRTMYEQFLSSVDLLSSLEPEERSKVADALVSRVYEDGEAVVRQGEMGDTFFFVEEGNAVVTKNRDGGSEVVGHLKKGDYFGGACLDYGLAAQMREAHCSCPCRTVAAALGTARCDGERGCSIESVCTSVEGGRAGRERVHSSPRSPAGDHGEERGTKLWHQPAVNLSCCIVYCFLVCGSLNLVFVPLPVLSDLFVLHVAYVNVSWYFGPLQCHRGQAIAKDNGWIVGARAVVSARVGLLRALSTSSVAHGRRGVWVHSGGCTRKICARRIGRS